MRRTRAVVFFLTAVLTAPALALGLGGLDTRSGLNEPLEARIPFTGARVDDFDTLRARLAEATQFVRAGIPREQVLLTLHFAVVAEEPGAEFLRVYTEGPVREPYLNFLIELDWAKGHLVREYTILLDPPRYALASPGVVEPPVVAASTPLATPAAVQPVPGGLPVAPAAVAAAAPGVAGSLPASIEVPPNVTAWELARRYRPDSAVTLHQMVVALARGNPQAFVDGNVNRLRRGAILRLPSREEIGAVSPQEASAEFQRQAAAWEAFRQQVATVAPPLVPEPPEAAREVTGEAAPAPGESAAATSEEPPADGAAGHAGKATAAEGLALEERDEMPAEAPDPLEAALEREARLELSAPETGADGEAPGNDIAGPLDETLAIETADVSARENAELSARLTEAEQIIDLLQRQLKVKDEELAALQAKAEQAAKAVSAQAAAKSAEPEESLADALVPAFLREVIPGGSPAALAVLVALIALLGLLIHRAAANRRGVSLERRESTAQGAQSLGVVESAVVEAPSAVWTPGEELPGLAVEEISEAEAEQLTQTTRSAAEAPPPAPGELDDVNVFVAYERFDQAEQRVREAIAAHPHHHAYKLRLLEVLYAANRPQAYEQAAGELQAAVGGAGELWQGAVAMWHEMSPNRALFAPASAPERADEEQRPSTEFVDLGATPQAGAPGGDREEPTAEELSRLGDTQVFLPTSTQSPAPPLDLDLGAVQAGPTPASSLVDISSAEAPSAADSTFIDLTAVEEDPAARAPESTTAADTEFDLSDTVNPLSGARRPGTPPPAEDMTLDFNLTLEAGPEPPGGQATVNDPGVGASFGGATPEALAASLDLALDETLDAAREAAAPRASQAPPKVAEPEFGLQIEDDSPLSLALAETTELDALAETRAAPFPEVTIPAAELAEPESLADITRSMEASIASLDVDGDDEHVLDLSLEPEEEGGLELGLGFDDPGSAIADTLALDPDILRQPAEVRGRAHLASEEEMEEDSPLQQADTKLNLARAYLELGDHESARQILEEVLESGNANQLEEARRLLAQLG